MVRYIEAILMLSGMIIGVGMFGIPYVFAASGFWLGTVLLVVLTAIAVFLHLLYGEIVLHTHGVHRMPGYARIYLGENAAALAWFSALFDGVGSLLAYAILGAAFLQTTGSVLGFSLGIFTWFFTILFIGASITLLPLRREAFVNGLLTVLLVGFVLALVFTLAPQVKTENLVGLDFTNTFLPYGVLLFELSGAIIIPDIIALLGRERKHARSAIVAGTIIPAFVYFIFALAVVGVLGNTVGEEAMNSLRSISGDRVILWGSLIGFLAVFTSFVIFSKSFQMLLRYDLSMSAPHAWSLAFGLPLFLYFLGIINFIAIMVFVGALAVAIDSLLIFRMHNALESRLGQEPSRMSRAGKTGIYIFLMIGLGAVIISYL